MHVATGSRSVSRSQEEGRERRAAGRVGSRPVLPLMEHRSRGSDLVWPAARPTRPTQVTRCPRAADSFSASAARPWGVVRDAYLQGHADWKSGTRLPAKRPSTGSCRSRRISGVGSPRKTGYDPPGEIGRSRWFVGSGAWSAEASAILTWIGREYSSMPLGPRRSRPGWSTGAIYGQDVTLITRWRVRKCRFLLSSEHFLEKSA